MRIHYNPHLKELARQLRRNSTLSEVLLWQRLRRKQIKGYDFHRQKPSGEYIVDFFCPKLNLIIEIDGSTHDSKDRLNQDAERQKKLESLGFCVLRFLDIDIKRSIENVLESIIQWITNYEKLQETHP